MFGVAGAGSIPVSSDVSKQPVLELTTRVPHSFCGLNGQVS